MDSPLLATEREGAVALLLGLQAVEDGQPEDSKGRIQRAKGSLDLEIPPVVTFMILFLNSLNDLGPVILCQPKLPQSCYKGKIEKEQ